MPKWRFAVAVVVVAAGATAPVAAAVVASPADPSVSVSASAADGASVSAAAGGGADVEPAQSATSAAVSLGDDFLLSGEGIAPGVVGLDWPDSDGATGYELQYRGSSGWLLLADGKSADAVSAFIDGSSAVVSGLPVDEDVHRFSVRARNVWGVSEWSPSVQVPEFSAEPPVPPFDPFTAPTLSGIDLERLAEAVATVKPGATGCAAVPPLSVGGLRVTDPPADVNDPDASLTVAEVVRVAAGCIVVEHVALNGRTVEQVRMLLAGHPEVHAVGKPTHGFEPAHERSIGYEHPDLGANREDQTGHHNDGGGWKWHLTSEVTDLWSDWDTDVPITVAVLDTGVSTSHRDLRGRIVRGSGQGCHAIDYNGHGTRVAGVIAGEVGNGGIAGVAPKADILPLRVLYRDQCDKTGESAKTLLPSVAVARAVNEGARVINMSFTGPSERDKSGLVVKGVGIPSDDTYELVVRAASMLGVVLVAAAGNCGNDADVGGGKKHYERNNCTEHNQPRAPAMFPDVISVAALNHSSADPYGVRLSMSTANDAVDIAAPGGKILSAAQVAKCVPHDDDNLDGDDDDATGTDRWTPLHCGTGTPPRTCSPYADRRETEAERPLPCSHDSALLSGTSMAAPFVSGIVAHMLNRYPDATPGQIRMALEESALEPPDKLADNITVPAPRTRDRDDGSETDEELRERLEADGRDGPTKEYGRGIVNPAGVMAELKKSFGQLQPSGPGGWFVEVSAGAYHGCGRRVNGEVLCWGDQAVVGATPLHAFRSLSSPPTSRYICGIRDGDGVAQCWGDLPSSLKSPVVTAFGASALPGEFKQIAAGDRHVCGIRPDDSLVCWGDDSKGRTEIPYEQFGRQPFYQAVSLSSGSAHSCAVVTLFGLRCWGDASAAPSQAEGILDAVEVSAGRRHTCYVDTSAAVKCWGDNDNAQTDAPAGNYRNLSAGADHTCALAVGSGVGADRVRCWGHTGQGRLSAPSERFSQVSAGRNHSCGVTRGMRTKCWGSNAFGQAPSEPRLAELTVGFGVDLLGGEFRPDVFEYAVTANTDKLVVRAAVGDNDPAASMIVLADGPRGPNAQEGLQYVVDVSSGSVIEVTVGALYGMGERQTYRVRVVEQPSLESLRLVPDGSGPHCVPQCAALELTPAFDPRVAGYRAVAGRDVSRVAVEHRARAGVGVVSPTDPSSASGDRVVLGSDSGFVSVSAGFEEVCGLGSDGAIRCWGDNALSQSDPPEGKFTSVSTGGWHSCALETDKTVACWGFDQAGRTDAPSGTFSSVSAGRWHTCGVRTTGAVACWGADFQGQSSAPSGSFASVSAGVWHSCGVKADKTVTCWGLNDNGQTSAPSGSFTSVSAGAEHSCGVKTDDSVVCWGSNADGQSTVPSGSFTAVSAGRSHTCGVKTDKTMVCWGSDVDGQSAAPSGSFTAVSTGDRYSCGLRTGGRVECWGYDQTTRLAAPRGPFSSVSTGIFHNCGIRAGSTVACWGLNSHGQTSAPTGSFSSVAAGWRHSCGVKADQSAVCWGNNFYGQTSAPSGKFASVSAAVIHSCGVKTDQTVACWGNNTYGQSSAPSGSFSSVSAGAQHTCGVKTDKTVACWGDNNSGEATAPAGSFVSVSAGSAFTCGVKADETVACWGSNDSRRAEPPAGSFSTVAAGWYHACGTRTDGTVVCWGRNGYGQSDAPAGSFSSVSAGINHSCGLASGGGVQCWGERLLALEPAPPLVVTVTVTSNVDPNEQTRYQVTIDRPAAPASTPGSGGGATGSSQAGHPGLGLPLGCEVTGRCTPSGAVCDAGSAQCAKAGAVSGSQPGGASQAVGKLATGGAQHSQGASGAAGTGAGGHTLALSAPLWTGVCPAFDVSDAEAVEHVVFADAVLHDAVVAALAEAPGATVTRGDLATLRSLTVAAPSDDSPRLTDLAGLEYAVNLTSLDIRGHHIDDLSPVGCLRRLAHAELGGNRIADVGPLRSLDDLRTLGLSGNRVGDIKWLRKLDGLQAIDVSHNDIASLAPLSGHSKLTALNVGGNRVSDLAPVGGLKSLRTLLAYDNQITDIGALAGLTGLRTLMVDRNRIASIDPVAAMFELRTLGAAGNRIVHVWALISRPRLERLYLSDNLIVHPFALTTLPALRTLWIDGNQIDNPWQLRNVNRLGYLDIRHNRIADTTILGALADTAHTQPQDTG